VAPLGYKAHCAFTSEVFPTREAVTNHPLDGGCDAARAFNAVVEARGQEAAFEQLGHTIVDDDAHWFSCLDEPLYVFAARPSTPKVQLANTNAVDLFEVLGLLVDGEETPWGGVLEAEDFLSRVLLAQGLFPGGVERSALIEQHEGGPTIINSGRPANYVEEKLDGLREVADYALAHHLKVCWG
jgi:hypothetical protein